MTEAPLLDDVAEGPDGGSAYWLTCADGTRIRIGYWPLAGARATVLMFPGRTEYIEKYGRLAVDLAARGYAMVAVDWRGQGLADRPPHRRDMGHVHSFAEYRQDVAALRAALDRLAPPKPWFLLAHSMGGAIGLRALHDGLPVKRAVFSAPMWGIAMSPVQRIMSGALGYVARPMGILKRFTPSTGPWEPMVFAGNRLTSDRDQFDYMERQTEKYPELGLGGPSIGWLHEALSETADLLARPAPDIPALTFLGSAEKIVSIPAVKARMAKWPKGELRILDGAEHEVLMEAPVYRDRVLDEIETFLAA
ncbi:alpha/beta fold hydrolase [Rhodobacterales bacterium HKCCE3408]|nr:alpha/beta fold hydrolase [Rhodobacterales bacterium HKCCE3408]